MKLASLGVALVWFSISTPAQAAHSASKIERGSYSRDAISVCSLPQSAPPVRIPSPDRKNMIVASPDHDSQVRRTTLTVKAFNRKFQAGFTWSADCEVAWSPDSRAFFATYSIGGAVGDFVTQVFFIRPTGLDTINPTKAVVKNFMSRPRYCYWDEGPNLGSISWLGDSSHLLLAAEVLPHSNCQEMGTFRAYEVAIPGGQIIRTYDQLSAKKLFWQHLGDDLRNADDECLKKPKYCQAEAIKLGRTRFIR